MFLVYSLLIGISAYIIRQDVKDQTIPISGLALFLIVSLLKQFFEPEIYSLISVAGITLILLGCQGLFYVFKGEIAMGRGDLILGPLCGLWLFLDELPLFFMGTGLIALLIGLFWRHRWKLHTFPMAPAILGGLGTVFLIRCFLRVNGV